MGSIPACAGEPSVAEYRPAALAVYPRVCGGTTGRASPMTRRIGLSPRVRGNRKDNLLCVGVSGSIPACAGEPHNISALLLLLRVYPRVCGGTFDVGDARGGSHGLSPRVRGNR